MFFSSDYIIWTDVKMKILNGAPEALRVWKEILLQLQCLRNDTKAQTK